MTGEVAKDTKKALASTAVFPGFKFSPTDTELISYYLKRKMEGFERCVEVIPEVEIYNFEPWDLPDKSLVKSDGEWFFFCARGKKYPHGSQKKRATEKGYWKATGKERNVRSGSEVIGTKRTLVFHVGRAPKGERTEWIMYEYCVKGVPLETLVVCRLRRNSEFQASSSQKPPDPIVVVDKLDIVPNGSSSDNISEWENMVDYYLSTESGQELINGIAESAQNPKAPINEELYAEILRKEIVKLDEELIQGSVNEIPRVQTEATTSRVLLLPGILDKQIRTVLQDEPSIEHEGEQKNEPLPRCLFGLFSVQAPSLSRWSRGVIVAVVMIILAFYWVSALTIGPSASAFDSSS